MINASKKLNRQDQYERIYERKLKININRTTTMKAIIRMHKQSMHCYWPIAENQRFLFCFSIFIDSFHSIRVFFYWKYYKFIMLHYFEYYLFSHKMCILS